MSIAAVFPFSSRHSRLYPCVTRLLEAFEFYSEDDSIASTQRGCSTRLPDAIPPLEAHSSSAAYFPPQSVQSCVEVAHEFNLQGKLLRALDKSGNRLMILFIAEIVITCCHEFREVV